MGWFGRFAKILLHSCPWKIIGPRYPCGRLRVTAPAPAQDAPAFPTLADASHATPATAALFDAFVEAAMAYEQPAVALAEVAA